jgi:transposase-like protein
MWWVATQKNGASALGLQRVLGLKSYETAWTWLHKLRRAMVPPGSDLLRGRVEVDECYLGGPQEGMRSGLNLKKALVVVAVEENGPSIGRIRMRRIVDTSFDSLVPFVQNSVEPGSIIRTDGWLGYQPLDKKGFDHQVTLLKGKTKTGSELMPRVHRVLSIVKRWLMETHRGSVSPKHLDYYLDEFTFRFNRRRSKSPGELFFRLVQQAVAVEPVPLKRILHPEAKLKASHQAASNMDRGMRLTSEIFPSLFFTSYKLEWYVEEIIDHHEDNIRQAVLDVIRGGSPEILPASGPDAPLVIFRAVSELGNDLFSAVLNQMEWVDENNPPEAYDEMADRAGQEAMGFVVRKYASVVSEIPGVRPTCNRSWLNTLRRDLLQIREEAKRKVHARSKRTREFHEWLMSGRQGPPPEHVADLVDVKASSEASQAEALRQRPDNTLTSGADGLLKESCKRKKPKRRNPKYEAIDRALVSIFEAQPKSHEEVFRFLDRKVAIPNRKPFKAAGGWLKGFQQNRHDASVWLSTAWRRLGFHPFVPGPKK